MKGYENSVKGMGATVENQFKKFRRELRENVRRDLAEGVLEVQEIAYRHGTSLNFVYTVAKQFGLRRKDRKAAAEATEQGQ